VKSGPRYGIRSEGPWCELQKDKGGENHEKAFSERSGNFAVIQLPNTGVILLSEVESDFFPSLTHGYIGGYLNIMISEVNKGNEPVYNPPSSPSSVLPPGNVT